MKLLLTGATGFLGSFFIEAYAKQYDIQTFSFLKDNIETLEWMNINTVVHLSALVHQMGGASKDDYWRINVSQTLALAEKAKENGVTHFIFMSTVKVYGEETDIPYTEESFCHPKDDYGWSKLEAEKRLQKLEDNHFKVSIVRTPIIYGYGVKANIKNFVQLIQYIPILPFANIQNKRSMVYIGNLCYLLDTLIKKKHALEVSENIFLASDDEILSTTQFIMCISTILNKKVYLVNIPFFKNILKILKPSFYQRLYLSLAVDNSKTKQILNVHNPYTIEEGMSCMLREKRNFK